MTHLPACRTVARRTAFLVLLALAPVACTTPPQGMSPDTVFDPYEARNRRVHEFNKDLDRNVIRPVSLAYTKAAPDEVELLVSNFADNLATPSYVVNDVLQGRLDDAFVNTVRFAVNTVLGFGGFVDAAGEFGVARRESDFGQTLHVWGVPEGAYIETPVRGPSTERDVAGRIVDLFTNPLSYVLDSPEKYAGTAANVLDELGDRGRYSQTVDSVLYDSADSYAQMRLAYLQARRYELGISHGDAGDPYGDPYADPYFDPTAPASPAPGGYDDPYAALQ